MTDTGDRDPNTGAERLTAGDSGDPVLDELGRWFRAAPPPDGLEPAALARVARRLDATSRRRRAQGLRSLVLGLALVGVSTASATLWQHYRPSARSTSLFARVPEAATVPRPKPPKNAHPTSALVPTPDLPAPDGAVPALDLAVPTSSAAVPATSAAVPAPNVAGVRSARPPDSGTPAAASSTPFETDLARESAALEPALTALRRAHDPARALALLERYAADFPAGVLRLEADVARVDAELALGNEAAALALLTRLPLERAGRGLELRLVRAELLAKRDCRAALLDFDRVVASRPSRAFDERALYGRASCRSELGDAAGANADFTTYVSRYPDGRFAALARSRLR